MFKKKKSLIYIRKSDVSIRFRFDFSLLTLTLLCAWGGVSCWVGMWNLGGLGGNFGNLGRLGFQFSQQSLAFD